MRCRSSSRYRFHFEVSVVRVVVLMVACFKVSWVSHARRTGRYGTWNEING